MLISKDKRTKLSANFCVLTRTIPAKVWQGASNGGRAKRRGLALMHMFVSVRHDTGSIIVQACSAARCRQAKAHGDNELLLQAWPIADAEVPHTGTRACSPRMYVCSSASRLARTNAPASPQLLGDAKAGVCLELTGPDGDAAESQAVAQLGHRAGQVSVRTSTAGTAPAKQGAKAIRKHQGFSLLLCVVRQRSA